MEMEMPTTPLARAEAAPTAASIAEVRRVNRAHLDLYAYLHSPEGLKLRAAMRLGPAPVIRSATEAEIMAVAAQLDAGAEMNSRLWVEAMTVPAAQDVRRAA